MKNIKLTKNKFAMVDDEDYEMLSQYRWYFNRYAYTDIKEYSISMHRILLGLEKGDGKQTDHINHNKLDNRRCNLRIATQSQNNANRKCKGVHFLSKRNLWRAMISKNGKRCHIGLYNSEKEAIEAHYKANQEIHGEFAYVR